MGKLGLLLAALVISGFTLHAEAAPKKGKSPISCRTAVDALRKNAPDKEVTRALNICNDAIVSHCAKNHDGTGDGRLIAASCMLNAMERANEVANNGVATEGCAAAYKEGNASPSTGEVADAVDTCRQETVARCQKDAVEATPAKCMLYAAYRAYDEITAAPVAKAAGAPSCGGKPEPRICKGSCYENYTCRANKWERSPVEMCRVCGEAEAGGAAEGSSGSAH